MLEKLAANLWFDKYEKDCILLVERDLSNLQRLIAPLKQN